MVEKSWRTLMAAENRAAKIEIEIGIAIDSDPD